MNKIYALLAAFAISSCAHYEKHAPTPTRSSAAETADAATARMPVLTNDASFIEPLIKCRPLKGAKREACIADADAVLKARINLTYDKADQAMVNNLYLSKRDEEVNKLIAKYGYGTVPKDMGDALFKLHVYELLARAGHATGLENNLYAADLQSNQEYNRAVDQYNAAEAARVRNIGQISRDAAVDSRLNSLERNTAPYPGIQTNSNVQIQFPK